MWGFSDGDIKSKTTCNKLLYFVHVKQYENYESYTTTNSC